LAGISYLSILIRDIITQPLKILSIPFLLLYPLEFVSLIGLYVAINIFIARRISVDLNVPGTIFVLTVLYRLYMSIFPTTAGYFKALLHEIKLHTIDRNRKLPPIKTVRTWNFSTQPPPRHKEKA
jgi:hypothetical protein